MMFSKVTLACILITFILMTSTEGKKTPCIQHPTATCNKYQKSCPNTYRCDKVNGVCCRKKNVPADCIAAIDQSTNAPYECKQPFYNCNSLDGPKNKYICIYNNHGRNRYSMCCENAICFDNSGGMHRKYGGEWTESDGCTVCSCISTNNTKCDDSKCQNKCGEFSQFSPCPKSSCGKQVKIRKCMNSKNDMKSQHNAELNMTICYPQPPAQCPQSGRVRSNLIIIPMRQGAAKVFPDFNYRWMVHFAYGPDKQIYCGGSILSPRHILTAAHCFYLFGKRMSLSFIKEKFIIKTGKYRLSIKEPLEQVPMIEDVIIYRDFDPDTYNNDIAIVVLQSPIQFNEHTHPINLRPKKFGRKAMRQYFCKVIGWGLTNDSSVDRDILLEIRLTPESHLTCTKKVGNVTENMFCATPRVPYKDRSKRLNQCESNSGGPFMCNIEGQWYQYGIVSFCRNQTNQIGVYTLLPKYIDWVKKATVTPGGWGEFSGYSPCTVSCGGGIRSRVKACTNPPPIGNGKCPDFNFKSTDDEMVYIEDEECNTNPC